MKDLRRRLIFCLCATLALFIIPGCAENEQRKVRVTEEQREGEVVEEGRGQEMIVK